MMDVSLLLPVGCVCRLVSLVSLYNNTVPFFNIFILLWLCLFAQTSSALEERGNHSRSLPLSFSLSLSLCVVFCVSSVSWSLALSVSLYSPTHSLTLSLSFSFSL